MTARRCPHCQYDFSDEEVRANIASKKVNHTGCLIILGVTAIVAFTGFALWPGNDQPADGPAIAASKRLNAGEEYAYKEAAKDVVGKQLRDPDSAIFSDMTVYPEREDRATIICGYVNSRNGFGGMTGPQRFIAGGTVLLEERFTKAQMSIVWAKLCN